MGLFLSMTGIVGSTPTEVRASITAFVQSGQMKEQLSKKDKGVILGSSGGVVVLYPENFLLWDDCTRFISTRLRSPAFSFHVHDGDLWMYILFSNGEQVDQFNPIPDYWEELPSEERERWRGNAGIVANLVPNLKEEEINRYLIPWELDAEEGVKAYPDDRFMSLDCWQIIDFMKKLNLEYPCDDQGNMIGDIFHMCRQ